MQAAKFFGGKSLKGTEKQKKWAENIRENILNSVTLEQAQILCTCQLFFKADFWINNRFISHAEIGEKALKANKIYDSIKQLNTDAATEKLYHNMRNYHDLRSERQQLIEELNKLFTVYMR
jgi:hypothetical protein